MGRRSRKSGLDGNSGDAPPSGASDAGNQADPQAPDGDDFPQDLVNDPDLLIDSDDPFAEIDNETAQNVAEEQVDDKEVDLSEFEGQDIDPASSLDPILTPQGWVRPDAHIVGRPVSPPLWKYASTNPNITQLRVWKVINGQAQDIGVIGARASHFDFYQHFLASMPKPGEGAVLFTARPINNRGDLVAREFEIGYVSDENADLKRLRASQSAGVAPLPAGDPLAGIMPILDRLFRPVLSAAEAAQAEAKAAREMAYQQMKQGADERIELAAKSAGSVHELSAKLLETQAAASQRAMEEQRTSGVSQAAMMQSFFTAQAALQAEERRRDAERYERERKDEADRRRRDQEDADQRRERERMEWDRQRERERTEAQARADRDAREFAQKLAEAATLQAARAAEDQRRWDREQNENRRRDEERDKERERQHQTRMKEIETAATRDREHAERMMQMQRSESPEGAFNTVSKFAGSLGIDVKGLVQKMIVPDSEIDIAGTIEGIGKVITEGIVKPMVDYAKTVKQVESVKNAQQQHPALMGGGGGGGGTQQITQQQGGGAPTVPTNGVAPPGAAPPPPPSPADNFDLRTQKTCREILRNVAQKLVALDESKWAAEVLSALNTEPQIYHWLKAWSIRGALADVGAQPQLIDRVLKHPALDNPLLADVPK